MTKGYGSRSVRAFILGLVLSMGAAGTALAQYGYGYGYGTPSESTFSVFLAHGTPILIGAILGFIAGAFFCPALKKFRRYVGWGALAVVGLYALFSPSMQASIISYLAAAIVFCVAFYFGKRIGWKEIKANLPIKPYVRPTSFGSAQWANLSHLVENGLIGTEGFMLGEFVTRDKLRHPLYYQGVRHLLTVAPTRSGKGVSSVIPNLLTYGGSVLVIDPKGENALVTAHRRGLGSTDYKIPGMGQDVLLLDPWDIASTQLGMKSACFNPIDWIKADDPDAAENAFLLADALVVSDKNGKGKEDNRFWDEEAKALLTGIILHVGTAEEEKGQRTLGRVRDILNLDDSGLKEVIKKMFKHPHPVVRAAASRQASKDKKLYSSVLAVAQSHTHFIDSPRIRESLSRSDFKFEDLKTKPTSVYLILPADRLHTFDRWLRLLLQQSITVNARNIAVKPEKPILFLLDEMATLGRLPVLEQAFGLMAGFGVQLWGIIQDLSQLANVYGEHGWQTFISNSGVIQYFGSRDRLTAEYFSALCGVTTIEVHNISWAIGKVIGFAFSYGSSGTSSSSESSSSTETNGTSEAQRKLAYPDELMVLKKDQQVVFVENFNPISGEKVLWYKDEKLKILGVDLLGKKASDPAKV